jgi:hypothetical protein
VAKRIVLEGPAADAVERLARSGRMSIAQLIASALRREEIAQRDVERPSSFADFKADLRLVPYEDPLAGPEAGTSRRDKP